MSSRLRIAAAALAGLTLIAGCGFKNAYSLPLPGGAANGKTYTVTAEFKDVQDLTEQAAVRVNDVAVGDVTGIKLDPHTLHALVTMKINQSVDLPANAVATLEQTTLLGEKFVSLAPPTKAAPVGRLSDGARVDSTSALPSVERVFGLLSQVLNGGDLADLQTINVEVSKALAGREQDIRGALAQLNTFVGGLAHDKQQIVRALDQLDRFSAQLAKQDGTIATALTDLGPGLRVLADERAQFTDLLTHLSRFGKVASRVIKASSTQTITGLRDLQPILSHLAASGSKLPHALEILLTFPFPRDSGQASPGDYTNLNLKLDLAPLLCAVFAGQTPSQLQALLGPVQAALVSLISGGTESCPKPGEVSSPVGSPAHSGASGDSAAKVPVRQSGGNAGGGQP